MQVICLSSEPWQAIPTRTQQLMTRLKHAQILFFEPPCDWGRRHSSGRKLRPGLTVYTLPPVLPVEERHHYLFGRNQARLAQFIQSKLERHRFRDAVLWCTCPDQVHLLDRLPYRSLVYDCDRAWNVPLRWESDLALAADIVFAASPSLVRRLSPCNDNIALLPNGANHTMFCRRDLEIPSQLQGLSGPVLGFSGTIWRDLDLGPLLQASAGLPAAHFLFIGRVDRQNPWLPLLEQCPNVHLLGHKPPLELPDYLGRFDVCLNFLRQREEDRDIIPPRMFEYFSTGKPIVTMLYPGQVEDFPDVVYGAHSGAEFAHLCCQALSEVGDWARNRRRSYGAGGAWSQRAEEVVRILETTGLG